MLKPRLPKNRRASVLIIVIVLLLLLAILGAAYISTSRGDRLSSAQSVLNAQTDANTQGIADLVAGTIADDLNDYVPTNGSTTPTTFSQNLRYPVYTVVASAGPPPTYSTTIYRNSYLGVFNSSATYNIGDIVSDTATPANFYVCNTNGTIAGPSPGGGGGWLPTHRWPGVTASGINGEGFQPWLADRIPVPLNPAQAVSAANPPVWQNITQSLLTTTNDGATSTQALSILGTPFESPDGSGMTTGSTLPTATQYTQLIPTFLNSTTDPTTSDTIKGNLAADGTNVPALQLGSGGPTFIAADADNDGIADSLLFRIPGAYFDGLTWYAAVRIIDNNSAINVNTAYSRDNDYQFTTPAGGVTQTLTGPIINYYGLFQTGVGLWELLTELGDGATPPTELAALNNYQYGNQTTVNYVPVDESTNPPVPAGPPNPRTDYQYITLTDALYHGLGRRLANPAINTYTAGAANYVRYQALPLSDEAVLASHFCLKTTNSSNTPQSLIEQLLPSALWTGAPTVGSYDPSNFTTWYNQNFALTTGDSGTSWARAYMVTRNPVSNYVPPVFDATNIGEPINPRMLPWGTGTNYSGGTTATYNHYKGIWNSGTGYVVNDVVVYPVNYNAGTFTFAGPGSGTAPTPGYSFTYICVTPNSGQAPLNATATANSANPMSINTGYWHLQPWTNHPVKANVNTAPFAELFRAFWCVMAGNPAAGINQPPFNNGVPYTVTGVAPPAQAWDYNPYDPTSTYPVGATPPTSGQSSGFRWHQFRSPLRDPTANSGTPPSTAGNANVVWMDPTNVAVLRAAIAAVNTLGLRDQSQNVISRQVPIQIYNNLSTTQPSANTWNAEATVFSAAPQPFISEVFATNDPGVGPDGYVGIELYNPYPFQMTLNNWQVAVINRLPTGGYPEMPVNTLSLYPLTSANAAAGTYQVIIPAYTYALLENLPVPGDPNTGGPGDAVARPAAMANGNLSLAGAPRNGYVHVYVNNLQNVMAGGAAPGASGGEFVLLRPRRADGQYTSSTDPFNTYNEGGSPTTPNLYDLVPVDSYDFTGLSQGGTLFAWSYIRQKPAFTSPPTPPTMNLFLATNAGAYVGNAANGTPRQQVYGQEYPTEVETSDQPGSFTTMTPEFGEQFPVAGATTRPYADFPPEQIYNTSNLQTNTPAATGATSPNPVEVAYNQPKGNPQGYPFGGFARNGDILNIPFVGAYRIRTGSYTLNGIAASGNNPATNGGTFSPDNPTSVVEMNSLPMDSAFGDDGDSYTITNGTVTFNTTSDDAYENVGRFYPTMERVQQTTGNPAPPTIPTTDYYFWAIRLFDYLTTQSNDDNYMPNFDPGPRDDYVAAADAAPLSPQAYFAGPVTQVYNADGAAPDQTNQDNVGVEGLININTASAQVLSLLPLVTKGDDPTGWAADCTQVAQNIVAYRNANGPFMSIYDLNKVPQFQNANNKITIGTANPGNVNSNNALTSSNGLLTPPDLLFPNVTTPGIENYLTEDFQSDNAVLSRISNMITTRSDTFTVYIVVEGWQNAILPGQTYTPGSPLPQLKVVRHYAFIADRSAINQDPSTRFLRTLTVPNN